MAAAVFRFLARQSMGSSYDLYRSLPNFARSRLDGNITKEKAFLTQYIFNEENFSDHVLRDAGVMGLAQRSLESIVSEQPALRALFPEGAATTDKIRTAFVSVMGREEFDSYVSGLNDFSGWSGTNPTVHLWKSYLP